MKNMLSIFGIVLVIIAVAVGFFWEFPQSWILEIVAASAGLAMVMLGEAKKRKPAERWKAYLIGFMVILGTMLAIFGGVTESVITTVVGSVLVIAGAAVGIISGVKNG